MENEDLKELGFVKKLIRTHWKVFLLLLIGVIGAVIGLFLVFYWVLLTNWVGGYGTWGIGTFSIGNLLGLFFLMLFAELLLVGLPFIAYEGIIFYLWWRGLSQEEKDFMKRDEKKEKKKQIQQGAGGGGFGFVVSLIFLLLVFLQGNWETPIGNLPYIHWINTWLFALLIIALIVGIPGLIFAIWWFVKKVPESEDME